MTLRCNDSTTFKILDLKITHYELSGCQGDLEVETGFETVLIWANRFVKSTDPSAKTTLHCQITHAIE